MKTKKGQQVAIIDTKTNERVHVFHAPLNRMCEKMLVRYYVITYNGGVNGNFKAIIL